MSGFSLYIHWPFCAAKCPYCDFNSRPIARDLDEDLWFSAYGKELEGYQAILGAGREVTTIYFGGGTPSLMRPRTIAALLDKIAALWPVQQNCEITIEANPSSSEIGKFKDFKSAGVNRVSVGVQALNDKDLVFLGRTHDKNAAQQTIEAAQKIFDRFSFDLIYGRSGQTLAGWGAELREALSFGAQHLSLYQLTIEEGTPFAKRAKRESLTVDDETSSLMFELTHDRLAGAGIPAYEVSNFAAAGQESRHNLVYWTYEDYVGIGPGAHGRFVSGGQRYGTENTKNPEHWLRQVEEQGHGRSAMEVLDPQTAQREALLMGLRLVQGIDGQGWLKKFGTSFDSFVGANKLETLIEQGLMRFDGRRYATTPKGLQCLNAVIEYLI